MGILDKFLIIFESDAKEASKDVKKLDKSLDDTEKSAKGATKASDGASKQFMSMGKKALGAVAGIAAIKMAITGLIATAASIDELVKFSDSIGENAADVDMWGGAVVRAGGSAESFQGSIKSLNEKMVDASVKGSNEITPFFNQLGVSIVDTEGKLKSTIDILPELAKSFEGMDKKQSLGIGQKLGLDQGTIALLQQGTGAIDKLLERQKRLGLVNEEAAKTSAEFNDIIADLKQVGGSAAQSLLITFVPAITWTIDKLIGLSMWMKENKPIVYGFFGGLAVVAIPVLLSLAAAGWAAIAPLLVIAAPFIAIAAAAALVGTAIALVVEDIMAFVDGQNSLLGDIAKKWPIIGDVVKFVVNDIKTFFGIMKSFGGFLLDIFIAPEKALESLKGILGSVKDAFDMSEVFEKWPIIGEVIDAISEKLSGFTSVVKTMVGFMVNLFLNPMKALQSLQKGIAKVAKFLGFGDDEKDDKPNPRGKIDENIRKGQGSIALAANSPIGSQTSNSIQNSNKSVSKNNSVQTGDIIIQTSETSAKGITSEVGKSLEQQMRTTVENFDDGIAG